MDEPPMHSLQLTRSRPGINNNPTGNGARDPASSTRPEWKSGPDTGNTVTG